MSPLGPGVLRGVGLVAPRAGARLHAPISDGRTLYQTLAYLEARDGVSGDAHALLAYKETDLPGGDWRVRVKSLQTAGGVFEPVAMLQQARAAATQGQSYFTWGYQLVPSATDLRQIEFRVHVLYRRPVRLELYIRLRRADYSADLPCSVMCDWP